LRSTGFLKLNSPLFRCVRRLRFICHNGSYV
jgi:hypothetical protein